MNYQHLEARTYAHGIGSAVADRTINRKIAKSVNPYQRVEILARSPGSTLAEIVAEYCKEEGIVYEGYSPLKEDSRGLAAVAINVTGKYVMEKWSDVAHRVALGSSLLDPDEARRADEYKAMNYHLRQASILMSGRHLQHGDENQLSRPMEVFTNCSTSASTFLMFYLLLSGSGVGRCYDDEMILVDFNKLPTVVCVLDQSHPDAVSGEINVLDRRSAEHMYAGKTLHIHEVEDSREGWAKALELLEVMAFQGVHRDSVLILDFSPVRCRNSPIMGMQGRPASGPGPIIGAIMNVAKLRDAGMDPWRAAMFADHYIAECVLVGGARRAARMATKTWRDKNIFDFINVKRGGFLWSSNNSVTVDLEFWTAVQKVWGMLEDMYNPKDPEQGSVYIATLLGELKDAEEIDELDVHAFKVFDAVCRASYFDGTGEPGLITVERLVYNDEGTEVLFDGNFAESSRYKLGSDTLTLTAALANAWQQCRYKVITNPCVTADTWVMTNKGLRQVSDLIDPFYNPRAPEAKHKFVIDGKQYDASGFFKTGHKQVFRLQTADGYNVKLTGNHQILVQNGDDTCWVEAQDLKKGDLVVISNNSGHTFSDVDPIKEARGYAAGFLVGDGTFERDEGSARAYFWDAKHAALEKLSSVLEEEFGIYRESEDGRVRTVQNSALTDLVNSLGMTNKYTKTITDDVMKKSLSFLRGFIAGLFDADGSVQGSVQGGASFRFTAIDADMLERLQIILAQFGITSKIYWNRKDGGVKDLPDGHGGLKEYDTQDVHELYISKQCMFRFAELFDFVNPDRVSKWDEIKASYGPRGPYKSKFVSPVVALEDMGYEDVYDVHVNKVHAFSANGIYAHNCGEIVLIMLGAYCTIADVVPFFAYRGEAFPKTPIGHTPDYTEWDENAVDAFRVATRALIRTNTMDCLYSKEVRRTNRIGVGMTGLHEYAWARFGLAWHELVDEQKSKPFWMMLSRFKRAVQEEAEAYSALLGVVCPHTDTTMKPAGTTSKLFSLTEGAHLPAMLEYLRWVQFRNGDPLIEQYENSGYPIRKLRIYEGTTIVGFPTRPAICELGMGDRLVTAAQATPDEQYSWLRNLEKYFIVGVKEDGTPLTKDTGNQVSYTLKYDPKVVDFKQFLETLLNGQSTIRCCSVMPQIDGTAYEYQPEEPTTRERYEAICEAIEAASPENAYETLKEDIGLEHVDCSSGACPIDFKATA